MGDVKGRGRRGAWARRCEGTVALLLVIATACSDDPAELGDMGRITVDMPDADAGPGGGPEPFEGPCVVLSPDVPASVELSLALGGEPTDVAFLVDVTASMSDEVVELRTGIEAVLAAAALSDPRYALATFADFPVAPYGSGIDVAFELRQPATDEAAAIPRALEAIVPGDGQDSPESLVEALYQLATGAGHTPHIEAVACTEGLGGGCFRADSAVVVVVLTDAPTHNGPGGSNPYDPSEFATAPASYDDAVDALRALGAKVVSLESGEGVATATLTTLARDTGALSAGGEPIVRAVSPRGTDVAAKLGEVLALLPAAEPRDVEPVVADPEAGDGFDARALVEAVVPLRVSPAAAAAGIETDPPRFLSVETGALLDLRLELAHRDFGTATDVRVEVRLRDALGRARGRQEVLLVDGARGHSCPSGG